ncbi:hypothetical protein ACEXQD_05130 [Herbiconiux sp. P15]|uniref:hypothetical protein n=1 Tax=Herbiconiux liukaitaii TaxID=3342799 RepID=UPI0035BB1A85
MAVDLIGNELTIKEQQLLDAYESLKALEAGGGLAPSTESNVRVALAALGVAVSDLALCYEHLTDSSC